MTIASGGKALCGASVGILMLEAQFPRIFGDMGHAGTWPFPVHYRIVRDASPERVVCQGAEGLLDHFIEAARSLVADGVDGITTNCGFLTVYQQELSTALPVPVMTSSLMQYPMVRASLPATKSVGIVTISRRSLTDHHLSAIGLPTDIAIEGTDDGEEFSRVIIGNELTMNVDLARQDVVNAAMRLQSRTPELGAIILECTNMVPYAHDVRMATGLPVYSIYSLVLWFQSSLVPRRF